MNGLMAYATGLSLILLPVQIQAQSPRTAATNSTSARELITSQYLFEVVRHAYRWHLDESDLDGFSSLKEFPFWVRELKPKLDPGDASQFAEIIMPWIRTAVKIKKTDYYVPELALRVKSGGFKIVNVSRQDVPTAAPPDCRVLVAKVDEMKEYLTRTRSQPDYPSSVLMDRLRLALRKQLAEEISRMSEQNKAKTQIVHVAPLSPVANEVWAYWETGRRLIRFASDIDLTNPKVWQQENLGVRVYDVFNQVVVSLDQTAGSNAFMTRDQIGRALYNCVVLGQRLELVPASLPSPGKPNKPSPLKK